MDTKHNGRLFEMCEGIHVPIELAELVKYVWEDETTHMCLQPGEIEPDKYEGDIARLRMVSLAGAFILGISIREWMTSEDRGSWRYDPDNAHDAKIIEDVERVPVKEAA